MSFNLLTEEAVIADFPMLAENPDLLYFDSAATTLKPACVLNAMSQFYLYQYGTVHRAVYELAKRSTDLYQNVRQQVKDFLNARFFDEIIFTKGTTESLNLIANSLSKLVVGPGDEILITQLEHHSNIVPWQMACQDRSACLKIVPADEQGRLCLQQYARLLQSGRVRIVSLAHIANSTGTLHPVKKIIDMAHRAGALVCIDAAQSVPRMPIDVQGLDADFLAFSGHKLYGPTGVGVLYGKKEWLQKMPPYQTGGSMIESVDFDATTFADLPQKFEAGTPMIGPVIGLGAALSYVQQRGMHAIAEHEKALMEELLPPLTAIPRIRLIAAPDFYGIVSFVVEGAHPLDIASLLDLRQVAIRTGHHCAQPAMRHFGVPSTCRISLGLYNTKKQIHRLVEQIEAVIDML